MIAPSVTHAPCDLNQQKRRHEARKDSLARAVARRGGRRSVLERLGRRRPTPREITAEDLSHTDSEDVAHSLRV